VHQNEPHFYSLGKNNYDDGGGLDVVSYDLGVTDGCDQCPGTGFQKN